MIKPETPVPVTVMWHDSFAFMGWYTYDEIKTEVAAKDTMIITRGWLLGEANECYVVASNMHKENVSGVIMIPKGSAKIQYEKVKS